MKKSIYSALFLATLVATGCIKKEDSIPERYTAIPGDNTNVKFLMLSPDAPMVNFFVDNKKISAIAPTATNVVQGIVFPAIYPNAIGYTTLPSGSMKIDAKVIDSSAVRPGEIIATITPVFEPRKFYTVAIVDSMHKISTVAFEDDPSVPDPTKAYFRVANFTSNSNTSNIKIEIQKTSGGFPYSKVYPAVTYKSVTAFDTLSAGGGQIYKVYLKDAVTDAKLDSISAFTPTPSKKYTIFSRGVAGLTGTNTKRPIITSYTNF